MSKQLDWEVYRYVLDDPTLDRAAFEALMLDDMNLALAVAEAVQHVDSLRAASFIAPPVPIQSQQPDQSQQPSTVYRSAATSGWQLSSLAALAAAFLLAIGLLNFQLTHKSAVSYESANKVLADNWLALLETELVDGSSNLVDVSTNVELVRYDESLAEPSVISSVISGSEPTADEDWLMDAAREFYAQQGG